VHSIRRSVVTCLCSNTDLKEISNRRFMRWSTGTLGVMPCYVQKPPEATDLEILEKHLCMEWWGTFAQHDAYLNISLMDTLYKKYGLEAIINKRRGFLPLRVLISLLCLVSGSSRHPLLCLHLQAYRAGQKPGHPYQHGRSSTKN